MPKFLTFTLALLVLAGFAPAQDGPATAAAPSGDRAEISAESEAAMVEAIVGSRSVAETGPTGGTGRPRRRHPEPLVQVRGDLTVNEGETVGDIVVVAGRLTMNGTVDGSVVSIASETVINGEVRDTLVVVPGPLTIGPKADLQRDSIVVGQYTLDPAAKIGEFHPVAIPEIVPVVNGVKDFLFQGVLLMRPLPPSIQWVWVVHASVFLVLLGLTLLFPKPVQLGAGAIADRPVVSMFSGFLTAILFVPLVVLLVITVVGIAAIPFAVAGIILASLFGKASVMSFLGQQVGRNLRLSILESPLLALVVGALILTAFYTIPILGLLVWCVATLLGLGAIMVATASALNNQPTVPTPVGVPLRPPVPPVSMAAAPLALDPSAPLAPPSPSPLLLQRVGFWKRFFAAGLDWILLSFPIAFSNGFFPVILIVYFVSMWTWKGTSIGKICLGLKIVRTDGTPIDFAVALVRSLSSCFSFVVFFLGFFWAGWDREKQSWHDKIAGTIVVQVPKGVSLL